MPGKEPGFYLKKEYIHDFCELSDEAAGQLIKLILMYENQYDIDLNTVDPEIRGIFRGIRRQVDYDADKYAKKCEQSRQAANMRWHREAMEMLAAEEDSAQTGTEPFKKNDECVCIRMHPHADDAKEKVKEKVKVKEKYNNTPKAPSKGAAEKAKTILAPEQEEDFERFWKAYPLHKSKETARKAWNKLNPDTELKEVLMTAIERQKEWQQWKKDGGQYIPRPSTWLNQKRWEDEPSQADLGKNRAGKTSFNNFEQKKYDYFELEKKVLAN